MDRKTRGTWGILLMIDAIDKHRSIWRGSSDNDFFSAVVDVRLALVKIIEDSSRVNHVVNSNRLPIEFIYVSDAFLFHGLDD